MVAAGGEALAVIIDVYSLVGVRGGLMDPTRLVASLADLKPPQLEAVLGTPTAADDGAIGVPLELKFSEAVVGEAAAALAATDVASRARPGTLQLLGVERRRTAAPRRVRQALVCTSPELLQRRRGGGGVGSSEGGQSVRRGWERGADPRGARRLVRARRHIAGEG